jgi:alkylated DNA repair dioxygenase AlkB
VTRCPHRPFPYPLLHCRTLSQLLVALSNLLSIALRHVSSPVLPILPHLRMQLVLDLDVGQAFGPDSYHFRDAFMGADADRLYAALRQELDYVPRASMTFSIFGKTFELPRDKGFYGDVDADGSYYLYRYGGTSYPAVKPWTPTLLMIRDALERATGQRTTHCVCNRYKAGTDYIGLHR